MSLSESDGAPVASMRLSATEIAQAIGSAHPPTREQVRVIEAGPSPVLVVAGAGSGKTETMAARVVWLVANGYAEPGEVLGLTFTRKAASELATRVSTRLAALTRAGLWEPSAVSGAPTLGDAPTVSTYHAFAGRIVAEHGILLGHESDARVISEAAAWQLAHDTVLAHDADMSAMDKVPATVTETVVALSSQLAEHLVAPEEVEDYLAALLTRLRALPPQAGSGARMPAPLTALIATLEQRRLVLPILRRYAQAKRDRGVVDYADQVALAARLARDVPRVAALARQRHRVVLLDEFQDTSAAQLVLLASLFAPAADGQDRAVTAVGDPNQSIYGWRGASATTLASFAQAFAPRGAGAGTPVLALRTSWRNDRAILDVANATSAPLRQRAGVHVPPLASSPAAGRGAVEVQRLRTQADEAEAVARWLLAHGAGAGHGPSAAVLCRKRSQFPALVAALSEHDVPHEVVGLGGLLLTPEVEDVVAFLHVVADPTRGDQLMRLLTGPALRIGPADIDGLWAWARHLAGPRDLDTASSSTHDLTSPSLVDALESPPVPTWRGPQGESVGAVALGRLAALAAGVQRVRGLISFGVPDLVGETERVLGLDIEVAVRPGYGPGATRVHLDALADVAAGFDATADRATLGGFLDWLSVAMEREDGLDRPEIEVADGAVQIMTVHAAKGLEWDLVAVPGLVESTFPSHALRSTQPGPQGWRIGEVKDWGWLGGLTTGGIPFELRGDADGLATWPWRSVADRQEAVRSSRQFAVAQGERALDEERRLAYVALTRARHRLLLSAHLWGSASTPRLPSRFLVDLVDDPDLGLAPDAWEPMPPHDPPATRPDDPTAAPRTWPEPGVPGDRPRVEAAARAVEAAAARLQAGSTAGGGAPGVGGGMDAELEVLMVERQRPTRRPTLDLPGHLSASSLAAVSADPGDVLRRHRRPLPTPPSVAARRGTQFHAWVESHYGRAAFLDVDDLPGSSDVADTDVTLDDLRRRFLASEWADRTPVELETPVETVVDGVAIRGRIDAVFADPDGRYTIVDWKTGSEPSPAQAQDAALQLAVYRLAWCRLRGHDPADVDAVFFYAATGVTSRPRVAAGDSLEEVIARLRAAAQPAVGLVDPVPAPGADPPSVASSSVRPSSPEGA